MKTKPSRSSGTQCDPPGEVEGFLENILASSTDYSIIGKDLDGKILLWKEGVRRFYGQAPADIVGKSDPRSLPVSKPTLLVFRKARMSSVVHIARGGDKGLEFLFATDQRERCKNPITENRTGNAAASEGGGAHAKDPHDGAVAECRTLGVEHYVAKPAASQRICAVTLHFQCEWSSAEPKAGRRSWRTSDECKNW